MILKFYAKEDQLVRVPDVQVLPNQPDMYVGRWFDKATRGYPAIESGFEIDSDTESGRRLVRLTQIDRSLFPADEATAKHCGLSFVETEFRNGVFVEKSKSPKKSPAPQES